jgi:hypothetical protein
VRARCQPAHGTVDQRRAKNENSFFASIVFSQIQKCLKGIINNNHVGRAYKKKEMHTNFSRENLKERGHLGESGLVGWIILK